MTETLRVLVYGTLRPGGALHHHWMGGATHLGTVKIAARMWEVPTGAYPVIRLGVGSVVADVYEMDAQDAWPLVAMERAAGYDVATVDVLGHPALVFTWPATRPVGAPVTSGDWITHVAHRDRRAT